jgi:hypothetical protein
VKPLGEPQHYREAEESEIVWYYPARSAGAIPSTRIGLA